MKHEIHNRAYGNPS